MRRLLQALCVFPALAIVSGCANLLDATNHITAPAPAEKRGDFAFPQQHYYETNIMAFSALLGVLSPELEAHWLLLWARTSAYAGKPDDAEWAFLRILTVLEQAGGKADNLRAPALAEFARYLHDTGQYDRAVPVYRDALEAVDTAQIPAEDPIAVAEFLDDYATSLGKSGRPEEAVTISQQAASLKTSQPGVAAKYRPKRYPIPRAAGR